MLLWCSSINLEFFHFFHFFQKKRRGFRFWRRTSRNRCSTFRVTALKIWRPIGYASSGSILELPQQPPPALKIIKRLSNMGSAIEAVYILDQHK